MFKKTWFFLPFVFAVLISACGGEGGGGFFGPVSYKLSMDNPLDTTMIVVIDDTQKIEIPGYEASSVTLEEGKHKVKATSITDSLIIETDFEAKESGILNLTKSQYLIVHGYYAVNGDYSALDAYTFKVDDTTSFDGVRAERVGSPSDIVVTGDWDYDLDEEMPETVETYSDSGTWRTKVYREDDYVFLLQLEKLLEEMDIDLEGLFEE